MSSNIVKPRFVITFILNGDVIATAFEDLDRALELYKGWAETDPSIIFLKINATGYVRRIYYPEQLKILERNDETFRDGWREFTGRVHSQAAEACINEIERQVEMPLDKNHPIDMASLLEGERNDLLSAKPEPEKECDYCSGSGCRYCHFGEMEP